MATNVARIQAELDLDSGKFHGSITSAIGQLKTFNTSVSQSDKSLKNIERRVTGLGASLRDTMVVLGQFRAAMHTVWAFTGQWVGAIVQANAKLERLQTLMKGLSNSATEAGRVADSLRDMNYVLEKAKNAPFTVDALADSFVKLKASGIDPTKGALDALTNAVAQFGGNSETLHRATIAIQQMAGKGVVSMEELRQQLGEAVPNAMQLMARSANMSMAELVKTVSSGRMAFDKVLQDKFFREMEMEFKGASENMMNTWTGMVQKLKTEWMLFAQEIGQGGLFEAAKKGLGDLITFMGSADGKRFAQEIGRALGDAARAAAALVNWLISNRSEIATWGKLLAQMFAVKKLMDFSSALVTTGAGVIGFTRTLGGFSAAWAAAGTGMAGFTTRLAMLSGPIGIAVGAIGMLTVGLMNNARASREAQESLQNYLDASAQGRLVSAAEFVENDRKLKQLRLINAELQEAYKNRNSSNQYTRARSREVLSRNIGELRKLGALDDKGNPLSDAIGLSGGWDTAFKAITAGLDRMPDHVRQKALQANAAIDASLQTYAKKLANSVSAVGGDITQQLQANWEIINKGGPGAEQAKAANDALRLGQMDKQIDYLKNLKNQLGNEYALIEANAGNLKEVTGKLRVVDAELSRLMESRANGAKGNTLLPKMGFGSEEKKQADDFLNLFQQLNGKQAELQARLDGGVPKLQRFNELLEQGKFKGNTGLIAGIRALYQSIDELEKKVDQQQAFDKLNAELDEMEARAKADVVSASIKASGDVYSQVASGLVGFNRQVEVMRLNLSKTGMTAEEFEKRIAAIRAELNKMDMIRFGDFVRDEAFENWMATLPEKERRLEEFNKDLREYEILRGNMIAANPDKAGEINDGVDKLLQSRTDRFHYENRNSWQKWMDDYSDITEEMDAMWGKTIDGMADGMSEMLTGGEFSFREFAKAVVKELIKIAVQWAIVQAIKSAGMYEDGGVHSSKGAVNPNKKFAKGGVMTEYGEAPLHKYARGGVANSPQLALFGEGSLPEAYVPLPDGRTIPVTMEMPPTAGGTSISNAVSIQVTVQSDGSAETDVSSKSAAGQEFGKMLDVKVRQVLSEEMRPGGTLWRMSNG